MSAYFTDFGISLQMQDRLNKIGITEPTGVQQKVMPLIAQGKNILFQSETGTGKTFAYLLPLAERLEKEERPFGEVKILIISPTTELASQIKSQIQQITPLKAVLCIGGAPISRQIESLKEKPAIVVGSPARLMELIHLKKLKAHLVEALVLDEADRLLSKELRESTVGLLERLPRNVQLIGNSATVNSYTKKILQEARDGLLDGAEGTNSAIELVELPKEDVLRKRIEHWALFAERRDKIDTLRSFINAEKPKKLIVFTSRSDQIENIVSKLRYKHIDCLGLSAKENKKERKVAVDSFRSGKNKILITTDISSRGLDFVGITHVVQMDVPEDADFFVHRAGRTARAGQRGVNLVIGDAWELKNYARLEKKLGITVHPKMLYKSKVMDVPQDDA